MAITVTGKITGTGKSFILPTPIIGVTGLFATGWSGSVYTNAIDQITISTAANATAFGTISTSTGSHAAAFSNGVRGVWVGGEVSGSYTNIIGYVVISTPGNTVDFGDIRFDDVGFFAGGTSNGSNDRGVFGGGLTTGGRTAVIDYVTVSSGATSVFFGNLTVAKLGASPTSSGTNEIAVFAGGRDASPPEVIDNIDTITISSTGNATASGTLTELSQMVVSISNDTNDRALFGGGGSEGFSTIRDIITYKTISTGASAASFGVLNNAVRSLGGTSDGTNERGIFAGGQTSTVVIDVIDYVTISSSPGAITATDFGDLVTTGQGVGATSDGQA